MENFKIEAKKDPVSISEVEQIEHPDGELIVRREQLKEIVEAPLLSACEELYDKNIKTVSTSANKERAKEGEAYIFIDFNSLSKKNMKIALELGEVSGDTKGILRVKISIPITESSTFSEIEDRFKSIVDRFEKQPMTWTEIKTFDQMKKTFGIAQDDPEYKPEDFEDSGFYYDKNSGLFYLSEEHFRKANEDIKEKED